MGIVLGTDLLGTLMVVKIRDGVEEEKQVSLFVIPFNVLIDKIKLTAERWIYVDDLFCSLTETKLIPNNKVFSDDVFHYRR